MIAAVNIQQRRLEVGDWWVDGAGNSGGSGGAYVAKEEALRGSNKAAALQILGEEEAFGGAGFLDGVVVGPPLLPGLRIIAQGFAGDEAEAP